MQTGGGARTELDEHAAHVVCRLRRRLKVGELVLACVLLAVARRHDTVLLEVALVGSERDHDVGLAVLLQLAHPVFGTLE